MACSSICVIEGIYNLELLELYVQHLSRSWSVDQSMVDAVQSANHPSVPSDPPIFIISDITVYQVQFDITNGFVILLKFERSKYRNAIPSWTIDHF